MSWSSTGFLLLVIIGLVAMLAPLLIQAILLAERAVHLWIPF